MQRKWIQIAIIAFMSFLLTACNIQSVEEYEKQQTEQQSVKESVVSDKKETTMTTEVTSKNPKVSETAVQPIEEQKQQVIEQQKGINDTTKQTPVTTEKTKTNVITPVKDDKVQNTKAPEPQAVPPLVENKRYVTIGIFVKTLLANKNKLDAPLRTEKYVPANGVVLKTTKYQLLHDNETVWDILVRATKEHGIHLEYQGANDNAYKSVYIEGINHLYEFSAGELSGWMYSVNGVFPKQGSSEYTLKDGDVIEWHYTVDLGRDLGQQVVGE